MAIVKFGPTVVGARGTIAGTIFSANKGGPYVRGWSRGTNPRSALQTQQRGIWGDFAILWAGLTQTERDDWDDYADDPAQEFTNSLGETYFASGFNWYIKINQNLTAAGEAARDDAPTLTRTAAPIFATGVDFRTTAGGNQTRVQFTAGSPGLTQNHVVVARVTTQGRSAIASGFTHQLIEVPNASRFVPYQDEIEASFGNIVLGQREFVQARSQDSHGQRSAAVAAFVDATTAP